MPDNLKSGVHKASFYNPDKLDTLLAVFSRGIRASAFASSVRDVVDRRLGMDS